MKRLLGALLLVVVVFCRSGEAKDLLSSCQRTLVVTGQGYFPVVLRLDDGRIAVVLRGGARHVGIGGRLDMVFSEDEGKSWSRPSLVNDSPVDDRNPAFGQAPNGDLVVVFLRTATYDERGRYDATLDKPVQLLVTRSSNGGRSWSQPSELDVSDIGGGSAYGKILTMPDRSMLMNVYAESTRPAGSDPDQPETRSNSYLYRSTDQGRTWTRWATIAADRFNETGLVRLSDGTLLGALRSLRSELWLSRSRDQGRTWSEPTRLVSGSVHPADICVLEDGRPVLVTGYRLDPYGVRGVIGDLQGHFDWQQHFVLLNDALDWDCGYPSSVILNDGRILTVYYATNSKLYPDWRIHCGALVFDPAATR